MNTKCVDTIAKAVLYEGYMLYPYRPSSVKNRQRFNFGVVYPRAWSEGQSGSDAWTMQTECLLQGSVLSAVEVRVRFLQLVNRQVGKVNVPAASLGERIPEFQLVPALDVNGRRFQPWQEAIEREVAVPLCNLETLISGPLEWPFVFAAAETIEPLRDAADKIVGVLVRRQESICGTVKISAVLAAEGVFRVCVYIKNLTSLDTGDGMGRDGTLTRSLVSAHTVLGAINGEFVSLVEPQETLRDLAGNCQNEGTWPVLVGEPGQRDTMLSSPIILYDYPQIAPESPGDLFDGLEIDEILALRILMMTEEEKREMRQSDERARNILERTESLPLEHLMKLHGTLRELRRPGDEKP